MLLINNPLGASNLPAVLGFQLVPQLFSAFILESNSVPMSFLLVNCVPNFNSVFQELLIGCELVMSEADTEHTK